MRLLTPIGRIPLALFAALFLVLAGAATARAQTPAVPARSQSFDDIYKRATDHLRRNEFRQALTILEPAFERAVRSNDIRFQVAFLRSIGNAQVGLNLDRDAISSLSRARTLAVGLGQPQTEAAISANLSNLHLRSGQVELALAEAKAALEQLPSGSPPAFRAALLHNMGEARFASGDRNGGRETLRQALAEARRSGDPATLANILNRTGFVLLRAGLVAEAEAPLAEALQIRLDRKLPGLDSSYRNLGMLRLEQGQALEAVRLLNRAVELFENGASSLTAWSVYYRRGRARQLSGDVAGALADFRRALRLARSWRAEMIPLDQVSSAADVDLAAVSAACIEAGMAMYRQMPSTALAAELLTVAEENRASGLRQSRDWVETLPPAYWVRLAELRQLEVAAINGTSSDRNRLNAARAEVVRMETRAGLHLPSEKSESKRGLAALRRFRGLLHPGEALISFHLGRSESVVWAVTSREFEMRRLAGRDRLARLIRDFRSAVEEGRDARAAGARLYQELFGGLGRSVENARAWLISADLDLFELPFAALVERDRYLVERRAVRLTPAAYLLSRSRALSPPAAFLGLADPIYNRADPRVPKRQAASWWQRFTASAATSPGLELSRIPNTTTEARLSAHEWKAGPWAVLTGAEVGRSRLAAELARRPAALHLSLHFIADPADHNGRAYIALGLDSKGRPDFLTASEIARHRHSVPLVVMSGCNSGRGQKLPGAGLTGLTRAWLLAGSRAVVASHWPTPDDTGALFRSFYRVLGPAQSGPTSRASADALRRAQVEMLRSNSFRSHPKYWGAFFVIGRD